ncbi:UDP-glucuronic acid decarboxylase family protein [Kangiella geojedonensis]|uniref:UDP-glucuronic acid decarboxylase family protein n=1 Tax=Kangiella geojedonensis TaxID=914150 RepID=UPI000627348B|nr:UDP-glucuronic acid decarboxylase family protein [Kangiella geojedonensis]
MITARTKSLVTGGAGFLGSNLCKKLIDNGNDVICIDNLHTGRLTNIEGLSTKTNFTFIEHDIRQPLPSILKVDEIYNLACPASPPHYQADPVYTFETSILGVRNVLCHAEKNNAKVLHASTSEVYGDPLVHPQHESYWGNVNPMGIRSCYDEGKRGAETLIHDYALIRGVEAKLVRIFNTYGENMRADDGRVVSNFICQAIKGKDITVYGDGSQTRSFCYVDDLIDGIVAVMESGKVASPYNLGNPNEFSMLELAEVVLKLTGSQSQIIKLPLPKDDPKQRQPVIDKIHKELGWSPKVQLHEGLGATIEYFNNEINQKRFA